MGKIRELPKAASCLLTSSQIITSVYSVVKELLENALDSSSKNVEVKLEDYGLEKIEVKDNGCGIDKDDIQFVAKPHFTSKIISYSDLEKIRTYGFRGEALGAICAVADLVVTTKSSNENIGHLVNFSHDGQIISNKPFPCAQGTTVSVKNLFKNIPVRRQYYRLEKNKKDELRKVEDLLIAFGCIQNDVRFALYHNKNLIWQKPSLSSTKNALVHILGNSVCDHLKYVEYVDEKTQRKIEIFLPKLEAPLTCGLTTSSRCITSINHRPVKMKAIDKLLKEYYNKAIHNSGKPRYPICFVSITIPLTEVDVNIEPNKTTVMLHQAEDILAKFSEILKTFYSIDACENSPPENSVSKESASDFLNSLKNTCDEKIQQSKHASIRDSLSSGNHSTNKVLNFVEKTRDMGDISIVPVSSVSHSTNKDANIKTSVEKSSNCISKKDVSIVGTPKESKKKKLKTILSKNDIDSHISTMKNFFSSEENSVSKLTDLPSNAMDRMPSVTVERSCFISGHSTDANKERQNIDSENITTFAVSKNLPSNIDDCVSNRKRHFSESAIFTEKIKEDIAKRPALDLNDKSENAWSRGVHPSGGLFQPVKILQPKAINIPESSTKTSPDNVVKRVTSEKKKFSFERKLTAFDIFCNNNNLEISIQNPEFNKQQIAQVLCEKWNCLSADEKAVYRNMLDKEYPQHVKKKERLGKIVSLNLSQGKDDASSCKTHKRKSKPKVKEKKLPFDIQQMRNSYLNQDRVMPLPEDLNLINYLAPGIWICGKGKKFYILNTFRLQETIIYHRLLETFSFSLDPLGTPQSLYASHLSSEGMEVLLQLSNLENTEGRMLDERLTANGFDIRFVKGKSNEIEFELTGITNSIAFYGLPDLKELLLLLKSKGFSAKLSECRPGKIMLYLQSEANRMSRQSPACKRIQDVDDLLNQKKYLPLNCNTCIHHKPFFNELYNISV